MILSGIKIEEEVKNNKITIMPFDKENINPVFLRMDSELADKNK